MYQRMESAQAMLTECNDDVSSRLHVALPCFSDASTRAVGGVLIQYRDGTAHPVAYVARKLTSRSELYHHRARNACYGVLFQTVALLPRRQPQSSLAAYRS